jgi:hypothetical protein
VDAIIQFGKGAVEIPGKRQAAVFVILETLKFLDEVKFELDGNPGGELESNVLVSIRAAVAARPGGNTNSASFLDPLLGRQAETVQTRLNSNPVEFDGIKSRVIEPFPDP